MQFLRLSAPKLHPKRPTTALAQWRKDGGSEDGAGRPGGGRGSGGGGGGKGFANKHDEERIAKDFAKQAGEAVAAALETAGVVAPGSNKSCADAARPGSNSNSSSSNSTGNNIAHITSSTQHSDRGGTGSGGSTFSSGQRRSQRSPGGR